MKKLLIRLRVFCKLENRYEHAAVDCPIFVKGVQIGSVTHCSTTDKITGKRWVITRDEMKIIKKYEKS